MVPMVRASVPGLQADRVQDVLHPGTMYLPHGKIGHDLGRRVGRERLSDLLRDVHIEFLQHLDAQAALARLPQRTHQIAGTDVLVSCRVVVRIDQDVGVDELQVPRLAHEAHLAGS